ncbi:hypothetical protein BKA80DRAFT_271923 [Phyllosticta citrichinensis]
MSGICCCAALIYMPTYLQHNRHNQNVLPQTVPRLHARTACTVGTVRAACTPHARTPAYLAARQQRHQVKSSLYLPAWLPAAFLPAQPYANEATRRPAQGRMTRARGPAAIIARSIGSCLFWLEVLGCLSACLFVCLLGRGGLLAFAAARD